MEENKKVYDNLIMSWSCFGDFVLISQTMKTLIDNKIIKRGIFITHNKELKGILAKEENIILLYPTSDFKDFLKLISLLVKKNIFILHDMPSYNRFSKQIRFCISIILTKFRINSKLLLLLDKDFKEDKTTKISKIFADKISTFDKTNKVHISQYMLDILEISNITPKLICEYNIKLDEKKIDISTFGEYTVIHPFASSTEKSLSIEGTINIVNEIRKSYKNKILIIGGKADKESADEIIKNTENTVNLCGENNFRETLYIIKNCRNIINIDSGPAHYAAAYQKPQLVIWGTNTNFTYMPTYNKHAIFLYNKNIDNISEAFNKINS